MEDIATGLASKLIHARCFPGTGSAIEDGIETLTHTAGDQAVLHFFEVLLIQQAGKTAYLFAFGLVVEEVLCSDAIRAYDITILRGLFRRYLDIREELGLHLVRERKRVGIYKAILIGKDYQARPLKCHVLMSKMTFNAFVILHELREVGENVKGYRRVAMRHETMAQVIEHAAFRISAIGV